MALAMQSLPYVYKLPDGTYIHIHMRQYGNIAPMTDAERKDWENDMARLSEIEEVHLANHKVERGWIEGKVTIEGVDYPKVPVLRSTYDSDNYPEFSDDYYAIMWKWGAFMAEDPNISFHAPDIYDENFNPRNLQIHAPSPCMPKGTHGNGHKMCTWSSVNS